MMFDEQKHARSHGKFASKGGASGASATAPSSAPSSSTPDHHSSKVPERIRTDETNRLKAKFGKNPTPLKIQHVLRGEANTLSSRAKQLMAQLHASSKAAESASHRRGEQRHQKAQQRLQKENAARAKRGLGPKKPRKQEGDRHGKGQGGGKGQRSSGGNQSGGGTSDKGTRAQLETTYQRLVVVRDVARSHGVKL